MKKIFILLLIPALLPLFSFAQHSDDSKGLADLRMYRDSLLYWGDKLINDDTDVERMNANAGFIKTLVKALKISHSFNFSFDSVKYMTVLNSPDSRFRIFTWHIQYDDGSYRFYGTVQMNTGDKLLMFPMDDYSPFIKNPEDTITNSRKWYGAQYYKIIPVYTEQNPYYVLLGWKGNNVKTTKKVIEVLSFNRDGIPVYGRSVFDGNMKIRKRVVFEYTRQASMLLNYVPDEHLIVFDHLAPSDKKQKGHFDMYGPDLSYDGYRFNNGRWEYVENLDMRNKAQGGDNDYIDPKKQAQIDKAASGGN
ncbi:MAG: hypothetical protein JST19_08080 [Bacteroidetes bacterium]|nr:hypothetical protein [Bacteroidota bacterium]